MTAPLGEELLTRLREMFDDHALQRLERSNIDYYSTHGNYLPGLATLLLAERAEVTRLLAEREAREALRRAVLRCCDETDYCYACDCHPSWAGHKLACPAADTSEGETCVEA